jgi:tetratricopeptide (TPR) repeat protein
LGGGLGFNLADDWIGGIRTQWFQQNIAGHMATGMACDLGVLYLPSPLLRLGADFQNLGVETTGENLPQNFRVGLARDIEFDSKKDNKILLDLDGVFPFQGGDGLRLGLEYANQQQYFFRAGYIYDFQNNELGGVTGLSLGVGFVVAPMELDYCLSFLGDLGDTQQISISFDLGPGLENPAKQSANGLTSPKGSGPNGASPKPLILKFNVTSESDSSAADLVAQGEIKEKAGLYLEALGLYSQATQLDPSYLPAWAHLGNLSYTQSFDAYHKYLDLDPNNTKLRDWLEKNK